MRSPTKTKYFPLGGGLDVVSPALSVKPGRLLTCVNFEPHYNDGYRRIDGYERFDGRPRPHLQTFIGFDLLDSTGLTVGTIVTGDTSGTTGTVIGISGNSIGVTKVTGTGFQAGETLNTATWTIDPNTTPSERRAPDQETEDAFLLAAQDEYRNDIGPVPGDDASDVNGVWRLGAETFAWRNNVGETIGVMHRATTSGWVTTGITLTDYVKFDAGGGGAGNALPVEGDTLTGATSGASGTVHRIIQWAGSTSGNDATGYIVLTNVTGGPFTDNEALQVGGTTRATANGASQTFEFAACACARKYRFHSHNFFGGSASFRSYGVNGANDAFEIDENNVVSPILIPLVSDLVGITENNDPPDGNPYLIEEHQNHLFLAFPGGRFVQSVQGEPMNFSGFLGAAEFGMGDDITGLNSVVGSVLVVTSQRETKGLFGKNILDWELKLIGEKTGGRLFSAQKIDSVYALDDLGVTSVARTDAFGDFAGATVSQLVQPIINVLRNLITDSSIVRRSNQYRLHFSDNTTLIMYVPALGTITEERATQTPIRVQFGAASYPIPILRIFNTDDEEGLERTFFTSNDGFVYEDQVGTNFDGEVIRSYIRTVFTHLGTPALRKKFRRLDVELSSSRPLTLKVIHDLSYGSDTLSTSIDDVQVTDTPVLDIFSGGGFWDVDNWDEFYWDGQNVASARAGLDGTGENISFLFYNESAVSQPFILQGLTVHYDPRRLQR